MLPIPTALLEPKTPTDQSAAEGVWVRKTPNLFRGVVELDCTALDAARAEALVRKTISSEFAPGVIVPFAFGTVLRFRTGAPLAEDLLHLIDDRSRARGTWQWIVLLDAEKRSVSGLHMWMRGYLTPVYDALIAHFESQGFTGTAITKQPSKFWTRLWAFIAGAQTARKMLMAVGGAVAVASTAYLLYRAF
jgi:hypothetical protein